MGIHALEARKPSFEALGSNGEGHSPHLFVDRRTDLVSEFEEETAISHVINDRSGIQGHPMRNPKLQMTKNISLEN